MARVCTECGTPLPGSDPRRKTCGDPCRSKRSRRLKRQKFEASHARKRNYNDEERALNRAVRSELQDVGHEVLKEELQPVVREAITEETVKAIGDLVKLTPTVVEKLTEDLESDDPAIRQRAYTLVAKYTIGHPAIVQPTDDPGQKQIVVNFALPRPGEEVQGQEAAVEVEADEMRQCDKCGADKPVTQFIAGSSRCVECYEEQQAQAQRILEGS